MKVALFDARQAVRRGAAGVMPRRGCSEFAGLAAQFVVKSFGALARWRSNPGAVGRGGNSKSS